MNCRSTVATVALMFAAVLFCAPGVMPAGAQQGGNDVLLNLQASAKLNYPDQILADFANGKPETAVIVTLRPTAAARDLAAQSQLSAEIPAEFTRPGAPTYYNLRDESIRKRLLATVTKTVNGVIDRLGPTGMTVTQRFSYQFGFAARVTPAALERIVNAPEVVSVEQDEVLEPHLAQGIPLMNAVTPRNTYTGAGLSIAICDTGIDSSHPSLGGGGFPNSKVIGGYDVGDNDSDPRPNSLTGQAHGTCCAGIAAGNEPATPQGDYIGGVASDAKLYAVKISTGTSGSAQSSAMIAGWNWCITHQYDDPNNPILVISTSFGGGRYTATCDSYNSSMTAAAANAVAAGITLFASSGNDGYCNSTGWPACITWVNSVGAVYDAAFGTYYPCISSASCAPKTATTGCSSGYYATDNSAPDKVTSYSNSASFLTLFAPSNQAYTLDIVGVGGYSSGNYDSTFGGTSAACPYAAGAAAVLQQAAFEKTGSYLTPAEVKDYLQDTGDNITDGKVAITKPRVNLGNAVNALPGNLPVVTIVATDPTATEAGLIPGEFTVTRTGNTTDSLLVHYTISGTATPGSDYQALSGIVIIDAGSSTAEITVTPLDDALVEPPETVTADLSATAHYTVGSPSSATVTITSDEVPPLPVVTIGATVPTATEAGPTTGEFTVTRSGDTMATLTVAYTVGGTATSGSDYRPLTGSVTIGAGSSAAIITVRPLDDSLVEPDETVIATLTAAATYTVGSPSSATVTITSDDVPATVTITAPDPTATEAGLTTGKFRIQRTGVTTANLSVKFTTTGTATSGSDYRLVSGIASSGSDSRPVTDSVTIRTGSSSATITVIPVKDRVAESPETAVMTLSASPTYTVGDPSSATVTITDK